MAETLAAADNITIAQLNPDLSSLPMRTIKAIVTLIWPYSSSNSSLTVLLAEPDFRLRKARGQVRVQFSGSSARSVFETGIGSGDSVILSLDGVEWTKDESASQTRGSGIDWSLKYGERLRLQIRESETHKISTVDIDYPSPRSPVNPPERELTPQRQSSPLASTSSHPARPGLLRSETNEWASPAFVKRARVSYGSLFQSGYDMFAEDDGNIKGKGRKRTRFSRASSSWRYSSRSPSFEPKGQDEESISADSSPPNEERMPLMTDEGCQTLDLENSNAAEDLELASEELQSNEGRESVSQNGNGVPIAVATETTGYIEFEKSASISSPLPRSCISPEIRIGEEDINKGHTIPNGTAIRPLSPGLSPDTSAALPLLSPLEHADTNLDYKGLPFRAEGSDDSYGISPAKQHHTTSHEKAQNVVNSNVSPDEQSSSHELRDIMDVQQQGLDAISHDRNSESNHDQGRSQSESSAGGSESGNETMDEIFPRQVSARHMGSGGFAMSRSQSGQSDLIDLTEDSDEAPDDLSNSSSVDEAERYKRYYLEGRIDDSISEEGQEYEDGNSDAGGFLEDGFDRESKETYSSGYPALSHDADTDSDGIEEHSDGEDGFFSEDDGIDQENSSAAVEGQRASEPDVIDLVSSDEGDSGDSQSSRQVSEDIDIDDALIDNPFEEAGIGSDMDADGDIEDDVDDMDDGRELSDRVLDVDLVQETRLTSHEDSELTNLEKVDEPMSKVIPDGYEISEHDAPEEIVPMEVSASSSGPREPGDPRDSYLGSQKTRLYTKHGYYSGFGGNDGASDELDHPILDPQAPEVEITTAHSEGEGLVLENAVPRPRNATTKTDSSNQIQVDDRDDLDEFSENNQLPTPEATQAIAIVNPDVSFDANVSTQSPLRSMAGDEIINDELHLLQSDAVDAVQLIGSSGTNVDISKRSVSSKSLDPVQHYLSDNRILEAGSTKQQTTSQEAALESQLSTQTLAQDGATEIIGEASSEFLASTLPPPVNKMALSSDVDHASERSSRQGVNETVGSNDHPTPVMEHSIEQRVVSPITPRRSKRLSQGEQQRLQLDQASPKSLREPTTPSEHDASVELAIAALRSPNKEASHQLVSDTVALRVKLSHPLRTSLGDFTTLKLIRFNLEKKLDFFGIVTIQPAEPQRAKKGLRQYHLNFNITDATIAPKGVIPVHIFRPFKLALPNVHPGDGVLLRNFLVKSEARGFALRSDDGSGWVVFNHDGEEEVRGPPVEYGDEERLHVASLSSWYQSLDDTSRVRLDKANGDKGSESTRSLEK